MSREPDESAARAPSPPAALDVPVAPVEPRRGRDVRAWLVGLAGLAVVVTSAGFAVLARPDAPDGPGPAAVRPSSSATTAPRPSEILDATPRLEVLPEIPNTLLLGAPSPVFFRRDGDDAHVLAWRPGDAQLRSLWTIDDAFRDVASAPLVGSLSPDKRALLVRGFDSVTSGQPDAGRATTIDGPSWTTKRLGGTFGVAWAPDSRSVVVSAAAATWLLVSFDGPEPVEREIVVDPRLEPLRPRQPGLEPPRITPAGFSADGRWIYGLRSRGDGTFSPAVRVGVADGSIEVVERFPTIGSDAIVPTDSLAATLDPLTGRSIDPRSLGFLPERPGRFDIHEADGTLAWSLDVDTVLSASWISDGRLVISEADRYPKPAWTRVLIVEPDGRRADTLGLTGPVTGTSIAGVFGDFALVGIIVEESEQTVLVCVLRLSDGEVSGLPLSAAELAGLQLGGWLP